MAIPTINIPGNVGGITRRPLRGKGNFLSELGRRNRADRREDIDFGARDRQLGPSVLTPEMFMDQDEGTDWFKILAPMLGLGIGAVTGHPIEGLAVGTSAIRGREQRQQIEGQRERQRAESLISRLADVNKEDKREKERIDDAWSPPDKKGFQYNTITSKTRQIEGWPDQDSEWETFIDEGVQVSDEGEVRKLNLPGGEQGLLSTKDRTKIAKARGTAIERAANKGFTPKQAMRQFSAEMKILNINVPTLIQSYLETDLEEFAMPRKFTAKEKDTLSLARNVQKQAAAVIEYLWEPEVAHKVGRYSGTLEEIARKMTGDKSLGEKMGRFRTRITNLVDAISRWRSGAALTEDEVIFYSELIGSFFKSAEPMKFSLDEFIDIVGDQRTAIYETNLDIKYSGDVGPELLERIPRFVKPITVLPEEQLEIIFKELVSKGQGSTKKGKQIKQEIDRRRVRPQGEFGGKGRKPPISLIGTPRIAR